MKEVKIPIIAQDLKQDEVCVRAIKTFEYLDEVIDQVFNRIDERIAKNMNRLQDVSKRLEKASEKIESLKGSKHSIKIRSPSKYPIASPFKFTPTFDKDFLNYDIDFNYNLQNIPNEISSGQKYSDKLQFFHVKRQRQITAQKPNLVFTTKSVNSLITFVNNENIIYNETTPKITIRKDQEPIKDSDQTDTSEFSRFSSFMKSKQDDTFHYLPSSDHAPDIDVKLPGVLPGLPGIADDVSFVATNQELIVPSLARMNIINELPNVDDLIEADSNKKLQQAQESKDASAGQHTVQKVPDAPPIPVNLPPPPPPPPIPQSFVPPPPPPVPKLDLPEQKPKAEAQSGDARSSLMQAIRNARGKSALRSVAAAEEKPEKEKKPAAAPSGDLMADLHAKLAMRRRGIAGSKEAKKEKVSIMDKVSSLIPPPATESDSDSSNGEDWD